MNRRQWILVAGGAAVAAVAAVVAVTTSLFLDGPGPAKDDAARFIPATAPVYASVDLSPGGDQADLAGEFFSTLGDHGFLDGVSDFLVGAEEETGIHFYDDVIPWIGDHVALAVLDLDPDRTRWVVLVRVDDRDLALDFVRDFVTYLEEDAGAPFPEAERDGASVWLVEDEDLALGLAREYLLLAGGEGTLVEMLDNLASPPSMSLAGLLHDLKSPPSIPDDVDQVYLEGGAWEPEEGVVFLFVQVDKALASLGVQEDGLFGIAGDTPEYLTASVSFMEDGLRLDYSAGRTGWATFPKGAVTSPAALPADTLLLLSWAGVLDAWEILRDEERASSPLSGEEFDDLLEGVKELTGIDLEEDVIGSLSGEVALALLPSDIRFGGDGDPLSGTLDILALAGLQDPRRIETALERLEEFVQGVGLETGRAPVGDGEAVTIDLGQLDESLAAHDAGYVVTEDWLAVGSTLRGLQEFHGATSGSTAALASSGEFARLMALAPDPTRLLAYADVRGLSELIEEALPEEARSTYRSEVKPLLRPFSVLLLAGTYAGAQSRLTAFLTLRD